MGRRDPMPMPPALGGMRGLSGSNSMRGSSGYDSMFSRRTPPRSSNGLGRFRFVYLYILLQITIK